MRILAVVAHPDDESFGAGGALAWHAQRGDNVQIVCCADGESSRFEWLDITIRRTLNDLIVKRHLSFDQACICLGASSEWRILFPDQQADTVPQLTINRTVERICCGYEPDLVYTHHVGDLNLDHRRVAEAVLVATRGTTPVRCMTPEWPARYVGSPFTFWPKVEIALTPEALAAKLAACACYADELRPPPHPRALDVLRATLTESFVEIP